MRFIVYDVEEFANSIKSNILAYDVETTGLDYVTDRIIALSFADDEDEWYLDEEVLGQFGSDVWGKLQNTFASTMLISHNTPFDMYMTRKAMTECGVQFGYPDGRWFDTMSMAALNDENLIGAKLPIDDEHTVGCLSLKALSYAYLGRMPRVWNEDFPNWTLEERMNYTCDDTRNTYDLFYFLMGELRKKNLLDYYLSLVSPLSGVVEHMERRGIKVDTAALLKAQGELEGKIDEILVSMRGVLPPVEKEVYSMEAYPGTKAEAWKDLGTISEDCLPLPEDVKMLKLGGISTSKSNLEVLHGYTSTNPLWSKFTQVLFEEPNPQSNQQLGVYLTNKGYKLPITKTGQASVSEEVLDSLMSKYPNEPLWNYVLSLRSARKLKSTYVDNLLEFTWEDGRVHPEWNVAGTVTGRFSCSSSRKGCSLHPRGPAGQTIPRPDTIEEAGWLYNPRSWFVAEEGKVLCIADLSQAEVRMLAAMSGDMVLKEVLDSGKDIHTSNAERMVELRWPGKWATLSDDDKKNWRRKAKAVTFGTMYGIAAPALSQRLSISNQEGQELLESFYGVYKRVAEWKKEQSTYLERYGYVTTLYGRRRSPVLIQDMPKVAAFGSDKLVQQRRRQLWLAELERECEKSGFDPHEVDSKMWFARAERQAHNVCIQGSVAEIINRGLVMLVDAGWDLLAQIHDEIIVELPNDEAEKERLTEFLKECFEVEINGVKFVLDIHFGESWAAK